MTICGPQHYNPLEKKGFLIQIQKLLIDYLLSRFNISSDVKSLLNRLQFHICLQISMQSRITRSDNVVFGLGNGILWLRAVPPVFIHYKNGFESQCVRIPTLNALLQLNSGHWVQSFRLAMCRTLSERSCTWARYSARYSGYGWWTNVLLLLFYAFIYTFLEQHSLKYRRNKFICAIQSNTKERSKAKGTVCACSILF